MADEHNVPAYAVFSDRTLRDLVEKHPTSRAGLAKVYGLGELKLARYGEALLELLSGGGRGLNGSAVLFPVRRIKSATIDANNID